MRTKAPCKCVTGKEVLAGASPRDADTMNKALDTAENTATTASSNQWMPMD